MGKILTLILEKLNEQNEISIIDLRDIIKKSMDYMSLEELKELLSILEKFNLEELACMVRELINEIENEIENKIDDVLYGGKRPSPK